MLKMLSNSILFIPNNVKGIQSFEKRIIFFEYSKNVFASSGFIFLPKTHSTMHDEKKMEQQIYRKTLFSHAIKAILAESLSFS